jgi:hypothetical protein
MSEIERCLEPHAEQDGIICDLGFHPVGYHYHKATRTSWLKAPLPSTTKPKPERIIDLINGTASEKRTGPPASSVGVIDRPYIQEGAPSVGYAKGSETSKASEHIRAGAQTEVYELLEAAGSRGLTGHEANDGIGKPRQTTGQVALSTLHLSGHIVRLAESRDAQQIYVLPEYINGRETRERGSHGLSTCPHCGGDLKPSTP